jgi:hypothetical protein
MLYCAYIYIDATSEKPVTDQSYGVSDRYGITILYKSLGGTNIMSFNEVFNYLSLRFVWLVLFYKPF